MKSRTSSLGPAAKTSPTFFGSANEIASPVTHGARKPNVLIIDEGFYYQEVSLM